MTQEDKDLLLKDLCARLPYGVKVYVDYIDFNKIGKLFSINNNEELILSPDTGYPFDITIEKCKPYLFPLSSMTEEQKKEFDQLLELELKAINDEIDHVQATVFEVDFYNKYHLDWRGMIPLGLAIDATNKNIY